MNILVTGACGFIGSHLVEELVRQNYKVTAFVFYNSRNSNGWLDSLDRDILKNLEIVSGDVRDDEFVFYNTKKKDIIFHLAALIGIPYSYKAVKSYIDTNIIGTYNLLNAAKKNNVSKTIITSTSEVYGTAKIVPIKESHSLNAQSPYAASKIGADQMAMSFYRSYNLPVSILRPFNTFGPRQSGRAIIPTIISQLLNNKKLIKLGNLFPTRDFTYVDDTVAAFISTIKKNNIYGEVINIGNKFEISIQDILTIMEKNFRFRFKVISDKKRSRGKKTEVDRLFSSNKKAKTLLNWNPKYAGKQGFIKGLDKTISWFKKDNNLKYYNSDIYNI
jgi:NAD dependent epimerase/dehydratase